ncbi:MAG: hypothetical protein Q9200_000013 [Gallowayella weberi]
MPNSPIGWSGVPNYSIPTREMTAEEAEASAPFNPVVPANLKPKDKSYLDRHHRYLRDYNGYYHLGKGLVEEDRWLLEDKIWEQLCEAWKNEEDQDKQGWTPETFDEFVEETVKSVLDAWIDQKSNAESDPEADARRLYEKNMRGEHKRLWAKQYQWNLGNRLWKNNYGTVST